MRNFYTQVKNTIDLSLKNKRFLKTKQDHSMLTNNDLIIQKKIISLIKKFYPDVKQFICEENFSKNTFKKINFNYPYAVIDPIDGTENFFAESEMFGTLISINSKSKIKIDLVYLPKENLMITRDNIKYIFKKAKKKNKITLLSTKCLSNNYKGSQYRIYGSSAYSFYKFIIGEAKEYIYCDGAKIWDCFTGLRLSSLLKCQVVIEKPNWINEPTYKTKFRLKWI